MPSSIEIHESLVGPLSERLRRAFDRNDHLLAGVTHESLSDRSIDDVELAIVFRRNFHLSSGSAGARAQVFVERIRAIAGGNGNETIDSAEEADLLYNLLTSEEGFLLAGGVVVYNNIDDSRETWVRLNCLGLSARELRSHILPHTPHRYLSDVTVGWNSEVPDGSGDQHLFTFTEVFGRDFPAFTRLTREEHGGTFVARWEPVAMGDPDFAAFLRSQRMNIETALRDASEIEGDADASEVEEAVNGIIENYIADRDSVLHASGSHTLNTATGDFVMYQHAEVDSDSIAPNASIYAAAVETALFMCGDNRYRSRPEIPAWIYEPLSYDPARSAVPASVDIDRDATIEPAD